MGFFFSCGKLDFCHSCKICRIEVVCKKQKKDLLKVNGCAPKYLQRID